MLLRLLFVDDDLFLLHAQRRLLWSVDDWTCTFCDGGAKALAHMAEGPFDVIVSDMRMPEMNGAELCRVVRAKYPSCVRIMLSGQTASGTLCRTFGPSHQFLQKPVASDELRQAVDRSVALRERLESDTALSTVQQLDLSDIAPSRRDVVRECRMATATKESLLTEIVADPVWNAKLERIYRHVYPDSPAEAFDLPGLLQPVELSELRVYAAAACVLAHLCEEFNPDSDRVDEVIAAGVIAARGETNSDLNASDDWDASDWAHRRSQDEVTLANLLHAVGSLLPFQHSARPQNLTAALLEQLGLPHSVVAGVAARNEVGC